MVPSLEFAGLLARILTPAEMRRRGLKHVRIVSAEQSVSGAAAGAPFDDLFFSSGVRGPRAVKTFKSGIRSVEGLKKTEVYFMLSGEFDIHNQRELAVALETGIDHRTVTIDLAQTNFIDASILGTLANFAGARLERKGAPVRIVNANAQLRKLFAICQLESVFDFNDLSGSARGRKRASR